MDNEKATSWKIADQEPPTDEQIENGRPTDEIARDPITPPLFCPCVSLAETSVLKIS